MNKLKQSVTLFFILFLRLKVSTSILSFSRLESPKTLNEIMVEIMRLCYFDLKYIVIFSDNDSYVENNAKCAQPVAIVLQNFSASGIPNFLHRHPIDLMIVDLHSTHQLQNILIVDSIPLQWSQTTSLFIIDKTSNNCKNVREVFKTTWNFTILIAFFLCRDSNQRPTLYTYNPYANRAPNIWRKVWERNRKSEFARTWTLYQRLYNPDNICEDFHFDRIKVLDGAVITVAAKIIDKNRNRPINFIYNESYIEHLAYPDIHISKALKYATNTTLTFNYNLNLYQKGYDINKQLKNGTFDLVISPHDATVGMQHSITYPIEYVEYYIFTNDQGHSTFLERMCNCLVTKSFLIIIFILSITSIVIIMFKSEETIASTLFEVFKLAMNVPLRIELNTPGLRIFFSLIFFYLLAFKISFNGNFIAHFIHTGIRKNVEALEDLQDSNYNTIYVNNDMYSMLKNSSLKNKVVLGTPYCEEQIKNSRSVACLDKIDVFSKSTVSKELHIAQTPVNGDYYVYLTRKNWPLKARLNTLFMRVQQAGLAKLWFRELDLKRTINMHRYTEKMIQKFHTAQLRDLEFLIVILMVGWTFAVIAFTLEKLL